MHTVWRLATNIALLLLEESEHTGHSKSGVLKGEQIKLWQIQKTTLPFILCPPPCVIQLNVLFGRYLFRDSKKVYFECGIYGLFTVHQAKRHFIVFDFLSVCALEHEEHEES